MKNTKHIVWFIDVDKIDKKNPADRIWWLKQVLLKGRMEDVMGLDLDEVEKTFQALYLPAAIKKLWEDYFEWKNKGTIDGASTGYFGRSKKR